METSDEGADLSRPLDAVFINAPLRDYSLRPRLPPSSRLADSSPFS